MNGKMCYTWIIISPKYRKFKVRWKFTEFGWNIPFFKIGIPRTNKYKVKFSSNLTLTEVSLKPIYLRSERYGLSKITVSKEEHIDKCELLASLLCQSCL